VAGRVLFVGGSSANSTDGDYLAPNQALDIDESTGVATVKTPNPANDPNVTSQVDVLTGGGKTTVTFSTNLGSAGGGCGETTIFGLGGSIDVCNWLRAKFPSASASPPSPGNLTDLADLRTLNRLAGDPKPINPAPSAATNAANPFDVNADGAVTPLDALFIVNYLNSDGEGESRSGIPGLYLDVNGDSAISPLDALLIINGLNSHDDAEGEAPAVASESESLGAAEASDFDDDLLGLLAEDALETNRKKK
jgi:hypothetical protein